jgi:tetratricopeptide (TPR) repeat protein
MSIEQELQQVRRDAAAGRMSRAADKCLAILRREPGNLTAIEIYGKLAMEMNQHAEAVLIFQKLLEIEPRHAGAHEGLAALFADSGDYRAATTHGETALQLNPKSVIAQTAIAKVLLSQNREDEALDAFERAQGMAPGNLMVEMSYADALLSMGRFDRASEVLTELISLYPDNTGFHYRLADTREWKPDDPDIALIRGLVGKGGKLRAEVDDGATRSRAAYMALFKLESALGNFDQAFEYLYAAKAIRKKDFPFDAERQKRTFDGIKALYSAEFIRAREGFGSENDDPIFVVGMPRSGTTLLERILSSSPNIAAAGELNLVERVKEEVCAHYGKNQYDVDCLAKVPETVWQHMGEEYVNRAWKRLGRRRHFVDKMPDNYRNLGLIKLMLPRARIINVTRHPVANCLSIFEQDFAGGHYYNNELATLGERYLLYVDLMEHWRSIFAGDIVDVEYESVVSDPAGTAEYLNQRLDLDIDLAEFQTAQSEGEIRTASRWQARQEIYTESVERWRDIKDHLQPLIQVLAPILDDEDRE